MATLNLKHIAGALPTNEPVVVELFEALIEEIGNLQDRIATLEQVREWNERFGK